MSSFHLKVYFIVSTLLLIVRCHSLPMDRTDESIDRSMSSSPSAASFPGNSENGLNTPSSQRPPVNRVSLDTVHMRQRNAVDDAENISHEYSQESIGAALNDEHLESHHSKSEAAAAATTSCHCVHPNDLPSVLVRTPELLVNALKLYSHMNGREKVNTLIREAFVHENKLHTTEHHDVDAPVDDDDDTDIDDELDKHSLSSEELDIEPLHTASSAFDSSNEEIHSPSIAIARDDLRFIDIPVNLKGQLSKGPFAPHVSTSPPPLTVTVAVMLLPFSHSINH